MDNFHYSKVILTRWWVTYDRWKIPLRGWHLNANEGTQNTKKKIDNSLQIFGITRN